MTWKHYGIVEFDLPMVELGHTQLILATIK